MAKKKLENMNFEQAIAELETIVQQLEQGELSLEDAMTMFERGLSLSQLSQAKLTEAEQRIQILLNNNGEDQLSEFNLQEN